ncbi:unnamed protein product [Orchesella dallaii]|uniref:Uncharacterized protein n=1 Tax=Orchesella dallaii TaxID=48710 RepID=A0ABP1QCB5_9HEXA
MASAALKKARGSVRVIGYLLFTINVIKWCVAILFLLCSVWVSFNRGVSMRKCFLDSDSQISISCAKDDSILSNLKNLDTLTEEEKILLATQTCVFGIFGLCLSIPQIFSSVLLLKATEKKMNGYNRIKMVDNHVYIQTGYIFMTLVLSGLSNLTQLLDNLFIFAYLDAIAASVFLFLSAEFLTTMTVEEIFSVRAERTGAHNEEQLVRNEIQKLRKDYLINCPV